MQGVLRRRLRAAWLATTVLASLAAAPAPEPAVADAGTRPGAAAHLDTPGARLDWRPCTLRAPTTGQTVRARCASLHVPERRDVATSRAIALAVGRLASAAPRPTGPPVVILAGGPGQSAIDLAAALDPAFAHLRAHRDVYLLDQRGTGRSTALHCLDAAGRPAAGDPHDDSLAAAEAFARRCAAALEADVRGYTTGEAAADLEALRSALGASHLDLVGFSYGTRLAQRYARDFPTGVRALVLDGVVPNDVVIARDGAGNLVRSLRLLAERCRADAACSARFGDLEALLGRLLSRVEGAPLRGRFRELTTGELREGTLGLERLAGVVQFLLYESHQAALLPLALSEADAGDPSLLLALARSVEQALGESLALGLHLSVTCAEDAWLLARERATSPSALAAPDGGAFERLAGDRFVEGLLAQCRAWPAIPLDVPGARGPLRSAVPTLLLSGELDPVTPPAYGERVLQGLSRGRHLVVPGAAHGASLNDCLIPVVARFLEEPLAPLPEPPCLARQRPPPFLTATFGWEP